MEIDGIKYYTEEELKQQLQIEGDRRVTSAQNKWKNELNDIISREKSKWEQESKMTADELVKKQIEEQSKLLADREREIQLKSNLLGAREKLAQSGIPKEEYEKMIDILVTNDSDKTSENINQFIEVLSSTKSSLENSIRNEFSKIPTPQSLSNTSDITKADFMKMSYGERIKLKEENPELFSTLFN